MDWKLIFNGLVIVWCLVMLVWLGVEFQRRGVFERVKRGIRRLLGID